MKYTDRQVQEKLLEAYESAITEVKKLRFEEAMFYLIDKSLCHGVCYKIERDFPENCLDWTFEYLAKDSVWWGPTPIISNTIEEIVESLQYRVDILIKILTK